MLNCEPSDRSLKLLIFCKSMQQLPLHTFYDEKAVWLFHVRKQIWFNPT